MEQAYSTGAEDFIEFFFDTMDDSALEKHFLESRSEPSLKAASQGLYRIMEHLLRRLSPDLVIGGGVRC